MNVNALAIFESVARHGNIRKASDELFVSPSAAAQRIRKLESELGCQLFERHSRGVSLTEKGKRLYKDVSAALGMLQRAVSDIQSDKNILTVSVPPSFGNKWLVPKLPEFRAMNPSVELYIIATDEIANFGKDGVDIAIRQASPPFESQLEVVQLTQADLVIAYAPSYIDKMGQLPNNWDFRGYDQIDDGHHNWKRLSQAEPSFITGHLMTMNQTGMAIDTALAGEGFCISSRLLIERYIRNGELSVFRPLSIQSDKGFYLLNPKTKSDYLDVKKFKDWLVSAIADETS